MKKIILTLVTTILLSVTAHSQPRMANNCIGLQISQNIDFLFDKYGQIEEGEVEVLFLIDKHNSIQVKEVKSNNPFLSSHITNQIQGMILDVKKDDKETLLYLNFVFQVRSESVEL